MWPTSKPSAKLTVHQNTLFFLLCIPCYWNTTAEKVNLRRSSWMNNAWILVQKQACLGMLRKHVLSGYAPAYVVINELRTTRVTLKHLPELWQFFICQTQALKKFSWAIAPSITECLEDEALENIVSAKLLWMHKILVQTLVNFNNCIFPEFREGFLSIKVLHNLMNIHKIYNKVLDVWRI